jgi:hypothetical protein
MPDYPSESQIPADAALTAKSDAERLTALGTLKADLEDIAADIELVAPGVKAILTGLASCLPFLSAATPAEEILEKIATALGTPKASAGTSGTK